ncbi:MAG: hypothetical protein JXR52_11285 [Bacteroidales bacterium]|nr:hypothetical protein [Bacteroidales bacterium]
MNKKRSPFKLFFFTILMSLVLIGCESIHPVRVQTDANDYLIITLPNPHGQDIILKSPDADAGSVGFESGGTLHWVKGHPVKTGQDKTDRQFLWVTGQGDSLVMSVLYDERHNPLFKMKGTQATRYFVNLEATEDEYFTGIFERVVDGPQKNSWKEGIQTGLNLRGERVEMKLKPTVSAYAPFYISSNNYSFFANGTWPGVFDFCKENHGFVGISFEGPVLEFKMSFAGTPMELVQEHALETGPSFIPPDWAFGPWRWRDDHSNNRRYFDGSPVRAPYNSDIVEELMLMKFFDIPVTAFWIDRPWGPGTRGFDDYEFDTKRFPEPEKMIAWLNRNNVELMIWIAPFVMGNQADFAREMGYYLESNTWMGADQVLMDFSNPEAVSWWGENGPGKLARMGIKGFKLDRADGEKLVDSLHLTTWSGKSYRENYNGYPHLYVKAAFEAVQPVLDDDFILFPRAQYTGSAKYGGMWAGDTDGKPEGLRSAIIALQRCAVMGYPVWGSDIGGYWGQFNRETCMRWLGFGCFSPIMETGPTRNRGFWNMEHDPQQDAELIATWRLYSKTREKLMPYIQNLAVEAHETGKPIARPLFLEYPEQPEAWKDWQTYLLGEDILVSIIWEKHQTSHRLYLPAGEKWVDAWNSHTVHDGGTYIEVDAPLHKTPVYIRFGSDIDLGDLHKLYEESLYLAQQPFSLSELEKLESW